MYTGGFQISFPLKTIGIIVSILAVCSVAAPLSASDGPGAEGALYLTLPVGPKSIAMGETYAAVEGDRFGWLANPGLLEDVSSPGFGIFHSQWFMDTYYDNAMVRFRPTSMFSLGVAMTYMSTPEVQGFDMAGLPTGMLKNNSFQGILGICVNPLDYLGAGINLKYFQETIADWTASGFGLDLGAVVRLPVAGLSIGASVQNIGPPVKFISHDDELPTLARAGASWYRTLVPGAAGLTLAADMVVPKHVDPYPSFGAELSIRDMVKIRAGYCGEPDREHNGFTAGGGVDIMGRLTVDYAWTPYGDLGNFHRVSVCFDR